MLYRTKSPYISTLNIIERCQKVILLTASQNAYYVMNTLEEKSKHRYLPENVSLRLCHLNPEYMMHQYPEELNGKVASEIAVLSPSSVKVLMPTT